MSETTILERPWMKNYHPKVNKTIDPDQYDSIVQLIEECVKKYKDLPAFSNMGKMMTYGELDQLSDAFGAYLQSSGLKPGDRIALMMPNLLQYPVALFGAIKAGLQIVNTNPLYTPREMLHQFHDSEVKAILILENFASNLQKILAETKIQLIITTSIGEMLSPIKGWITNFVVRNVKKMVPTYQLPNEVKFSTAINKGKRLSIKKHYGKPDDTMLIQYTGGTTGIAKGAMLTNRNLIANMLQVGEMMKPFVEERKEIVLCPLPMYHIYAFTVNTLSPMYNGFHSVLITNARDLSTVVDAFKKYKITMMTGVNTLYNALLNNEEFTKLDIKHLKIASAGGMALQDAVADRWEAITGTFISQGYGLTETAPVASTNSYDETCRKGTIGYPIPSTDMRVVDDNGRPLGVNEVGEIQIKGPQVMKGYFNRPEETEKVLTADGWFSTGDIGLMDEDGFFKIVDRKKDMILVSGFNVFPNEVEEVLAGHPKILESAVIGVADEKSGEVVKAFIVKKDASLTKEEIIAYCKENLTAYKVPRIIEFRETLPKSNVGKILRKELRDA